MINNTYKEAVRNGIAENRAFISAENRIEKEFKEAFSVFLSQLHPR
ncbi:MAG: hypothetical protein FWC19_10685 [Treponema sp.]|nr:hypothetical protein [Treponema sp.]